MKEKRRPFQPKAGHVYRNHGGGDFLCLGHIRKEYYTGWTARMQNIASGWTFEARGICCYADGRIDWDYSVGGQFAHRKEPAYETV